MHDAEAIGALTAKVDELARACARLSQENAELRSQVSALSAGTTPADWASSGQGQAGPGWQAEDAGRTRISRRAAVGVALAGAAAGIAGATALTERGARPAAHASETAATAELTAVEQARVAAAPSATGSVISATLSTASAVVAGSNTSTGPGIAAVNTSTGPGVHATSGSGRGGVFAGGAAQIQLTPGAKSHPASGQRGDLYADASGRLWYCKTTGTHATWHQIA